MPINTARYARLPVLTLALAVSLTGCRWLIKEPEYSGQELAKPLTIPAGLSKPTSREALNIPPKSMIGANAQKAPGTRSLDVKGDVATVWKKVGDALAGFADVTITAKAESISSYEVLFSGETFLVSVQANGAKSKIVAVGIDGSVSDSAAAATLIARFKPLF